MSSSYSSRDDDLRRQERGRDDRRRSRSRSRSRRHRGETGYRSRSRSNSVDRHRRRHQRSRSRGSSSHHKSSRRQRDTRSRSRSRSHTHSRSQWSSSRSSRSPKHSSHRQESRRSRSNSVDRNRTKRQTNDRELNSQHSTESRKTIHEENSSTQYLSSTEYADHLDNLPLPDQAEHNSNSYEYYDDTDEPIDKERIHREMEEKLRQALAKEGKVYPPPKPEASHPVFANDGSFLEIFKKMQEQQQQSMSTTSTPMPTYGTSTASTSTAAYVSSSYVAQPPPPMVGRRRGGKILKTGVVAKPKALLNGNGDDKDFWSLYLAEVNKYKNNACELDSGNRPLLK